MDCRVWQKAHRLYFLWPWRRASSSDDGPANEPSAEILGCRGGARSQEVRQGIFTTDEGSPHLEWHRRFGDGPDALGAREDRVYVEISTYCQKVRPNRNFSRLRYLTLLADIKERWHIDDRLCVRQSRFASCMGKGCEHCRRPPSSPSGLFWTDVKRAKARSLRAVGRLRPNCCIGANRRVPSAANFGLSSHRPARIETTCDAFARRNTYARRARCVSMVRVEQRSTGSRLGG